MLCDVCGKNQASVHLTEIVNSQMTELHLCENCAREKSMHMQQQFGLADLLAGLAQLESQSSLNKEVAVAKCAECQITYDDFRKTGRLGCGGCYAAFKKFLSPLLRKIHGSTHHIGKKLAVKASRGSRAQKSEDKKKDVKESFDTGAGTVQQLKVKLQKAVSAENFEEAACLRDKIKELENGGK